MERVEYDPNPPNRRIFNPASLSNISVRLVYFPLKSSALIVSVKPAGSDFTEEVVEFLEVPITSRGFFSSASKKVWRSRYKTMEYKENKIYLLKIWNNKLRSTLNKIEVVMGI